MTQFKVNEFKIAYSFQLHFISLCLMSVLFCYLFACLFFFLFLDISFSLVPSGSCRGGSSCVWHIRSLKQSRSLQKLSVQLHSAHSLASAWEQRWRAERDQNQRLYEKLQCTQIKLQKMTTPLNQALKQTQTSLSGSTQQLQNSQTTQQNNQQQQEAQQLQQSQEQMES